MERPIVSRVTPSIEIVLTVCLCSWPELEEQPTDDTKLRHEQIKLRVAEVEAVVDIMQKLSRGEKPLRSSINSPDFDWDRWRMVDCSRPIMAGHSLGGSAAVRESTRLPRVH